MPKILYFLLRLLLLAAGLVVAASLAVAFAIVAAAWALRAGWARLTGKPVSPFVMRMRSRDDFTRAFRPRPAGQEATPRATRLRMGRPLDVTDVEPRNPSA